MYPIRFIFDGVKFELVPDGTSQHPRQLEASEAPFILETFDVLGSLSDISPKALDKQFNEIEDWNPLTSDDPVDEWPSNVADNLESIKTKSQNNEEVDDDSEESIPEKIIEKTDVNDDSESQNLNEENNLLA